MQGQSTLKLVSILLISSIVSNYATVQGQPEKEVVLFTQTKHRLTVLPKNKHFLFVLCQTIKFVHLVILITIHHPFGAHGNVYLMLCLFFRRLTCRGSRPTYIFLESCIHKILSRSWAFKLQESTNVGLPSRDISN